MSLYENYNPSAVYTLGMILQLHASIVVVPE